MADDEKEARFLRWLTERGAKIDALAITRDLDGGRGVVATRDLAPNEVAMSIPEALMISEASVKLDPDLGPIFARHSDLFARDDPLLATFVAHHMHLGHHSFYYPYLSTLPAPESIQNWTIDELASLQDPRLVEIANQRNAEIVTWYERLTDCLFRLYPELFNATSFSFETFRFAWQTIQARTFGRCLPWSSLVPFADMLNHNNHATMYAYENKTFEWHSSVGYKRGDQVFNRYGRRPNHQLLLHYGFALRENAVDYIDMDFHLAASYPSALSKTERRAVLSKAHLMPFKTNFRLTHDTSVASLLPYFCCHFLTAYCEDVDVSCPISDVRVETRAIMVLIEVLEELAAAYPTTLEEDAALLQTNDLPDRLLVALTFRMGRKQLLSNIITAASAMLQTLTTNK
ncbi:hypothetical protein SDRG_03258 [Saprolegnia diclina VS20]|uniref:SET domain-containing protein n=1 Tax=Saprolegnia diclina (strain VS20) TaxID=1156394 RepID=T0QYC6_SAPDV|nr:hypothetical protein SDRG_03258 [Saprolegnia diclina VS20]EQC39050.1 hypothetical protein SDRG_03258 [Saprolegnia diclina VS20]|eukprot:XP_008607111.1 hypothetical protein SDRG_03258 [Saprolegnia diclina VS20]